MTKEQIDRINELARKAKTPEGLTLEELAERDFLRKSYIEAFRENLRSQLEQIKIVEQAEEAIEKEIEEELDEIDELEKFS
ncbi:MAG: DUF896 domain-containing protein [Eubacterium sp.]|nr:DUF896 domain-containing protein [Eubacterium sp.]